jgi:hypothetical protein
MRGHEGGWMDGCRAICTDRSSRKSGGPRQMKLSLEAAGPLPEFTRGENRLFRGGAFSSACSPRVSAMAFDLTCDAGLDAQNLVKRNSCHLYAGLRTEQFHSRTCGLLYDADNPLVIYCIVYVRHDLILEPFASLNVFTSWTGKLTRTPSTIGPRNPFMVTGLPGSGQGLLSLTDHHRAPGIPVKAPRDPSGKPLRSHPIFTSCLLLQPRPS